MNRTCLGNRFLCDIDCWICEVYFRLRAQWFVRCARYLRTIKGQLRWAKVAGYDKSIAWEDRSNPEEQTD